MNDKELINKKLISDLNYSFGQISWIMGTFNEADCEISDDIMIKLEEIQRELNNCKCILSILEKEIKTK